jgi:hypothetical protein
LQAFEVSTVRIVLRPWRKRTKYALLAVFGVTEIIDSDSIPKIWEILDFSWGFVSGLGVFFFVISVVKLKILFSLLQGDRDWSHDERLSDGR